MNWFLKARFLIVIYLADTLTCWNINDNVVSIFVRIDVCDAYCSSVRFMRSHICLAEQLRANEIVRTEIFTTLLSWSYVVKRYIIRTELLVELITKERIETRVALFFYLVVKISITSFALSLFDSRSAWSVTSTVRV